MQSLHYKIYRFKKTNNKLTMGEHNISKQIYRYINLVCYKKYIKYIKLVKYQMFSHSYKILHVFYNA